MSTTLAGPTVPFSEELHSKKYRQPGETFEQAMHRVASGLADSNIHENEFRDTLLDMRFMPAGRIQTSIGSKKHVTAMNCYVLPVDDSFVHGDNSIMNAATKAAATMRMGGGVGYSFSRLRPKGDLIEKLQSHSSGPVSFMEIFDAVCRCTASAGHRQGAQMGVMRVDHPDIFDFVKAKTNRDKLTGFNVSVGITDEFMYAAENDSTFPLKFNGKVYKYIRAAELWDLIMRSTWDWAEPGVVFLDTINKMNNLWYCETIEATNPCAEQPLPPFGSCLLGSFNLVKYIRMGSYFDREQLRRDIPGVVRAMDNVIDRTIYPLEEQRMEAFSKRRMGLGITGLANAAETCGKPYGSAEFLQFEEEVLTIIRDECYAASSMLAREKGTFPLYDKSAYLAGHFVQTLSSRVKDLISRFGIRNSHLTSIAPTGTISMCADNVSSGIEPVFDYEFARTVIEFTGPRTETVYDYGVREFGVQGKRCKDVTVKEHIDVLVTAQRFVDSAVSKTCNVPSSVSYEEFKGIYMDAWKRGAKGAATFRLDGKRVGVLQSKDPQDSGSPVGPSCEIDPKTGKRDCS
jgi:ribonucleoside-diphosphate reductase alpha chain